jgi:hypothetical protein
MTSVRQSLHFPTGQRYLFPDPSISHNTTASTLSIQSNAASHAHLNLNSITKLLMESAGLSIRFEFLFVSLHQMLSVQSWASLGPWPKTMEHQLYSSYMQQ